VTLAQKLFGFQGRLRRRDFWTLWISCTLTAAVLFVVITRSFGIQVSDQERQLIPLAILWPTYALLAKRMHDRNRSAWWALLLLAPELVGYLEAVVDLPQVLLLPSKITGGLVALWFFFEFGFLEGTLGDNRFGPSPKAQIALAPLPATGAA
jgi:uncharacterized membrane protein YhaH (DUF805 family)